MAIIRYRDPVDGTIKEMACLKGDKGDPGSGSGATNAKDVAYDGSEQYIGGSTVEEALNNASNFIVGFNSHVHNAFDVSCGSYGRDISHVGQALECIFGELDIFSEALDELHAYAQGLVNGGGAE